MVVSSFLVHYDASLQNATDIKKCDSYFITKYDKSLLQICVSECVCVCLFDVLYYFPIKGVGCGF